MLWVDLNRSQVQVDNQIPFFELLFNVPRAFEDLVDVFAGLRFLEQTVLLILADSLSDLRCLLFNVDSKDFKHVNTVLQELIVKSELFFFHLRGFFGD